MLAVIVQAVELLLCDKQAPARGLARNDDGDFDFCLGPQYAEGDFSPDFVSKYS